MSPKSITAYLPSVLCRPLSELAMPARYIRYLMKYGAVPLTSALRFVKGSVCLWWPFVFVLREGWQAAAEKMI